MPIKIVTINVNGIRAATRKGMVEWLATAKPDVVAMQEVRAPDELVAPLMGKGWHVAHSESLAKGRAGVAIASRAPMSATSDKVGASRFNGQGRWIESRLDTTDGKGLTVISTYAHTGDATDAARMEEKLAFFTAITKRITKLRATGQHVLLTGDLNVGHREVDIKNFKGNIGAAGFLPEERAHFDHWFDKLGWVDVGRKLGGDGPGPFTWWSMRGKAFDTDTGWRIDYQIATPELAALAKKAEVHRAPSWAERWSDHAPLVVTYKL